MVSILMPIYNGIEFIEDSINSIMAQTYPEWELLIGINGHPEKSEVYNIANKYSSEKIFVFDFPELKGKSLTLNKLLTKTAYDSICLIDVDDIWAEEKLIYQIHYIDKYDVVGTNCQYFGDSDAVPWLVMGDVTEAHLLEYNSIINCSVMINRRNREIFWDPAWDGVEDYDLWMRLTRQGWSFFNINAILVGHRIHKNSFFNTKNRELAETLKKEKFNI
jgi:teichuronic acid biosynthesis glycosyltransferase TuaG